MEYYNLYDKTRKKVIKTIKSNEDYPSNLFREIIHVLIFNDDKLLIQKRSKNKTIFPNLYNLGVSGNVRSDESVFEAAKREVKEELNLDLNIEDLNVAFTINFDKGFDDFFLLKKAINFNEIKLDTNEVDEVLWADIHEIKNLINNNKFVPYTVSFVDLIFFMKDECKIHSK